MCHLGAYPHLLDVCVSFKLLGCYAGYLIGETQLFGFHHLLFLAVCGCIEIDVLVLLCVLLLFRWFGSLLLAVLSSLAVACSY